MVSITLGHSFGPRLGSPWALVLAPLSGRQHKELQRAALNAHGMLNHITGTTHHTLGQATKEAERTLRLDAEEKRTLRRLRRKANLARHVWVPIQTSAMETRARGTTVATQTEPDHERQAQETSSTQKPGKRRRRKRIEQNPDSGTCNHSIEVGAEGSRAPYKSSSNVCVPNTNCEVGTQQQQDSETLMSTEQSDAQSSTHIQQPHLAPGVVSAASTTCGHSEEGAESDGNNVSMEFKREVVAELYASSFQPDCPQFSKSAMLKVIGHLPNDKVAAQYSRILAGDSERGSAVIE